jgi:hypothetical protein
LFIDKAPKGKKMYPAVGNAQTEGAVNPSPANNISSLGAPPQENLPQQPNPQAAKSEELINNFGQVFQQLNTLASSFPGASAEFNMVVDALKAWLAKASDSAASEGVGNSPTY